MNEPDAILLEQARGGDHTAFDALFLRHYQRVYRVSYHLTGSHEEAEDLVQETFFTLYHRPPAPNTGDRLATWLCRVALNRGYNMLRGKRRERERLERNERLAPANGVNGATTGNGARLLSAATDDPYDNAARNEERAQARAILARLPERQSKLLLLRYAGCSYAEIAAILGVAPGSVGTLLARAERAFVTAGKETIVCCEDGIL